jgi:SAM-dependent methyltransferase
LSQTGLAGKPAGQSGSHCTAGVAKDKIMTDASIYTDGEYFSKNPTWHQEDSPWKANEIDKILSRNRILPKTVVEVGCGAGVILSELGKKATYAATEFFGFDLASEAIRLAKSNAGERLSFACADYFEEPLPQKPDVMLAIDVAEHVPDYMGFFRKCQKQAEFKVYHIPLDLHVSSVARAVMLKARESVGHLHYFSAETALATLKDTGHNILDYHYTAGAVDLAKLHPSAKKSLANLPRRLVAGVSEKWSARLFGGYSLMVLAR